MHPDRKPFALVLQDSGFRHFSHMFLEIFIFIVTEIFRRDAAVEVPLHFPLIVDFTPKPDRGILISANFGHFGRKQHAKRTGLKKVRIIDIRQCLGNRRGPPFQMIFSPAGGTRELARPVREFIRPGRNHRRPRNGEKNSSRSSGELNCYPFRYCSNEMARSLHPSIDLGGDGS